MSKTKKPAKTDEQKLAEIAAKRQKNSEAQDKVRVEINAKINAKTNKMYKATMPVERKLDRKRSALYRARQAKCDAVLRDRNKAQEAAQKKYDAEVQKVKRALDKKIDAAFRKSQAVRNAAQRAAIKKLNVNSKVFDKRVAQAEAPYNRMCAALNRRKEFDTRPLCKTLNALREEQSKLRQQEAEIANRGKVPPAKGAFTFYKKVYQFSHSGGQPIICTMQVSAKAQRLCGDRYNFKSRVSAAKVVKLEWLNSGFLPTPPTEAWSGYVRDFKYKVGEVVRPRQKFDTDKNDICSSGIHGYMTIEGARNH